jgi:hypothetical protein
MSDVVIRSTENSPNLVIVDGKVAHAFVPVRRMHPHALLRRHTQEKQIHSKNTGDRNLLRKSPEGGEGTLVERGPESSLLQFRFRL